MRERLKNRFIKSISELGQLYEEMDNCDGAIDCYHKGLDTDDLTEDFYLRLMKCYQRNGRRADAMMAYRRCEKTLSAVLGIEPSPEIRSLYQTLKDQ